MGEKGRFEIARTARPGVAVVPELKNNKWIIRELVRQSGAVSIQSATEFAGRPWALAAFRISFSAGYAVGTGVQRSGTADFDHEDTALRQDRQNRAAGDPCGRVN